MMCSNAERALRASTPPPSLKWRSSTAISSPGVQSDTSVPRVIPVQCSNWNFKQLLQSNIQKFQRIKSTWWLPGVQDSVEGVLLLAGSHVVLSRPSTSHKQPCRYLRKYPVAPAWLATSCHVQLEEHSCPKVVQLWCPAFLQWLDQRGHAQQAQPYTFSQRLKKQML